MLSSLSEILIQRKYRTFLFQELLMIPLRFGIHVRDTSLQSSPSSPAYSSLIKAERGENYFQGQRLLRTTEWPSPFTRAYQDPREA
jgi:hypothetical protein